MPTSTGPLGPYDVRRVGFGAMQLPGPGVLGPPRDREQALAVVRRARELGVDHIDTASFYGPDVANSLLAEALSPWPEDVRLVSKVGAARDANGAWLPALSPESIRAGVDADLRVLGIKRLTAVNLRVMPSTDDEVLRRGLDTLVSLREESKLELIGLSSVGLHQLDLAADVVDIACVQNQYGLLDRGGEDVLVACGERGIAFVPFFPLGSAFGAAPRPDEHPEVRRVAQRLGATRPRSRSPGCCTTPITSCSSRAPAVWRTWRKIWAVRASVSATRTRVCLTGSPRPELPAGAPGPARARRRTGRSPAGWIETSAF